MTHHEARHSEFEERRPIALNGPKIAVDGMLELAPKGFGFLRVPHKNFEQARDDVFVSPESIRKHNLRVGQWIHGNSQEGPRGPQLVEITAITLIASSCSVAFIRPISAVIALPERLANSSAASTGPSSRSSDSATSAPSASAEPKRDSVL